MQNRIILSQSKLSKLQNQSHHQQTNTNNHTTKFNQTIKSQPQPSICTLKTRDVIPKPTSANRYKANLSLKVYMTRKFLFFVMKLHQNLG